MAAIDLLVGPFIADVPSVIRRKVRPYKSREIVQVSSRKSSVVSTGSEVTDKARLIGEECNVFPSSCLPKSTSPCRLVSHRGDRPGLVAGERVCSGEAARLLQIPPRKYQVHAAKHHRCRRRARAPGADL